MIRSTRFLIGLLCLTSQGIQGQADYQGLRLALFDLEILKQTAGSINLRCQVANTGRLPVDRDGKGEASFPPLVVELDTLHLPAVLRERPGLVQRALLRVKIRLAPGAIESGLSLTIHLQDTLPETVCLPICTHLVIDTAYGIQKNERTLTVRFHLRNAGETPVQLSNAGKQVALNTYFVSGDKLTRGAIFAEQIMLKPVRELADGTLAPGASVSWEVEVTTQHRTRFSPHLALEFDPWQALPDCSQRGRVWVLK